MSRIRFALAWIGIVGLCSLPFFVNFAAAPRRALADNINNPSNYLPPNPLALPCRINSAAWNADAGQFVNCPDGGGYFPVAAGPVASGTSFGGGFTAVSVGGALPVSTPMTPSYASVVFTGHVRDITCSYSGGSGGSTGVVIKARDLTAGSDLCHCTLGACSSTSVLTCDCNSGAMTATHQYALEFASTTDCAVDPANVFCFVELTSP